MPASTLQHPMRPDEQLVFIHIPKTAGTTFGTVLNSHFLPHEIFPILHMSDDLVNVSPQEFTKYRFVRGHYFYSVLSQVLAGPAAYITMLRDPIERSLSHYGFLQDHDPEPRHSYGPGMDIEEFVFNPHTSLNIIDLQTRLLGAKYEIATMADLIDAQRIHHMEAVAGKSASSPEAIEVLDQMAFFGLAERFDDSLALLAYTLGWPPIAQVQKENVGHKRLRRDQVPPRVLQRIIELNQEDIKLYTYAERLFAARYNQMLAELLDTARHQTEPDRDTIPERATMDAPACQR